MSDPVFVVDANGSPLMPMAPALARKLAQNGKAHFQHHYVFTILQLSHVVASPKLRPITAYIKVHAIAAEVLLVAEGTHRQHILSRILVDLSTDMPRRLRRRAGHRRRRRARQRFHTARHHGIPYKRRRPSMSKSSWSTFHPHKRQTSARPIGARSPLIRWRAAALVRVIQTLRHVLPISHIVIRDAILKERSENLSTSHAQRRVEMREAYAIPDSESTPHLHCHYCGTESHPLQIEHVVPRSQGGTDAWNNLVFACELCNRRKGARNADEAGMSVQMLRAPAPKRVQRTQIHERLTVHELARQLRHKSSIISATNVSITRDPNPLQGESAHQFVTTYIAVPVARGRKQVFSSRNYALTTPTDERSFVHCGQTIKRRVRVNYALALLRNRPRREVRVLQHRNQLTDSFEQLVTIGTLCLAERSGVMVTGIVSAIHSTGRLTLKMPYLAGKQHITWNRTTITKLQTLRVLSRDRVLFFKVSPKTLVKERHDDNTENG